MRQINLAIAVLYSILFGLLFLSLSDPSMAQKYPHAILGLMFLCPPVLLNWVSAVAWKNPDSKAKVANLVIAILYTVFLAILAARGLVTNNVSLVAGIFIFAVPTVFNWFSYFFWTKPPSLPASYPVV